MSNFLISVTSLAALVAAIPQMGIHPGHPLASRPEPKLDGDGDPHQIYKYIQITAESDCGNDQDGHVECAAAYENAESYGVSWGADINDPSGWISGSFSVTKETTTGTSHECSNKWTDGEDEELLRNVCVWKRVPHTEYTIQDRNRKDEKVGDPYQMWSPNEEDQYQYVCAWGDDCWDQGDEWWGPSREPGGPEVEYDFEDRWQ